MLRRTFGTVAPMHHSNCMVRSAKSPLTFITRKLMANVEFRSSTIIVSRIPISQLPIIRGISKSPKENPSISFEKFASSKHCNSGNSNISKFATKINYINVAVECCGIAGLII